MNISLTRELESFVNKQVKSGLYHSASEVIRAGLRRLKEEKERGLPFTVSSLEELEEKLSEGVEQLNRGEGMPGEAVFTDLRKRSAEARRAKG